MSDPYLDHLPSHEREKIRKKLRSPAEYERVREKVKGPEDLEKELDRSEKLAEAHLALESEPQQREKMKAQIEKDIKEKGIDAVLESAQLSPETKKLLEEGKFLPKITTHPKTHHDALVIVPVSGVQESFPVKQSFAEQYVSGLLQK